MRVMICVGGRRGNQGLSQDDLTGVGCLKTGPSL